MTSAPNRAMSNRLAPTAISSMPQQAVANGIGQRLYLRHQLTTESSVVTMHIFGNLERVRPASTATVDPARRAGRSAGVAVCSVCAYRHSKTPFRHA